HRLRHLHPARRRGGGPPLRTLGRNQQNRMRTTPMSTTTINAEQTNAQPNTELSSPHLAELEAESLQILREVAGQFDRPALLFSGGKDSVVVLELAKRAFHPAPVPFELLHVDTGHNFPEVLEFRDRIAADPRINLHVAHVQDWIDSG